MQAQHAPLTQVAADKSGAHSPQFRAVFERMRTASRQAPAPSYAERIERLERLAVAVRARQNEIAETINSDFGNRSARETKLAEVLMLLDAIKYLKKNLKRWMKPEKRQVSLTYLPASARVHRQPLGVVGVISPWNYPFHLGLGPTAVAIAAGNRVMIKPSEYTPGTSALLATLCGEVFDPDVVSVVQGGPDVGEAFSRLPFDHLVYTGSVSYTHLTLPTILRV